MRTVEKITLCLPPALIGALRQAAAKEERPISAVVRRALERYLKVKR